MTEIFNKWNSLCESATIFFNANEKLVFSYAIVEVTERGYDTTKAARGNYIEYNEIKAITDLLKDGKGRLFFDTDPPKELIVGSKNLILFIATPQSENKLQSPAAILHLKSGRHKSLGPDKLFFSSRGLSGSELATNGGAKLKPTSTILGKSKRNFWGFVGSSFTSALLAVFGMNSLAILSGLLALAFGALWLFGLTSSSTKLGFYANTVSEELVQQIADGSPQLSLN